MKPKYKIVAGPTQFYVERYGIRTERVDIDNSRFMQQAEQLYRDDIHDTCKRYIQLTWVANRIVWSELKQLVEESLDKYPSLYFDGPSWIVSTVPWKHAKYKEWFIVSKRIRWLLKKEYTNGVRNRQEEAPGVPTV